jgi:hypothetical protein
LGGGVYLGSESKTIEKDLDEQRRLGSLDSSDPRITKGKWFAIGADGAFAAGGLLAVLSAWNFIKDPLPESSSHTDDPREFDDPAVKRGAVTPLSRRSRRPPPHSKTASTVSVAPLLGEGFGGFGLEGRF